MRGRVTKLYGVSYLPSQRLYVTSLIPVLLSRPTPTGSIECSLKISICVSYKCTGLPSHFQVSVWPDSYVSLRVNCLITSGVLISLQQLCHTYITSWFTQGLALLRPVNPSRQLRRPQRHAPTTTPLHPLPPLPKRRTRFIPVRASHPLPKSKGPYLVYSGPSTSAILFYQSSWRHHRHLLLILPILTAAT